MARGGEQKKLRSSIGRTRKGVVRGSGEPQAGEKDSQEGERERAREREMY